jgi:glycosyltransferase involved in cell wall biosynthesis
MNSLIVTIMGQNCEKFIGMCLESVKDADAIVYCDGGSQDRTKSMVREFLEEKEGAIIEQWYNQTDKQMNGKQRNFYLKYLKENYPNDWALCLDADEVVEDLSIIKEFIQTARSGLYSPKMRHFIGDLGHEDAMTKEHWVLNRLFDISKAGEYPLVEHPVLQSATGQKEWWNVNLTTIWHLAYVPNMWDIKKRYDNHMKKSNMHTPEYLKQWYSAHLFGTYPKTPVNPAEIPSVILKEFGLDRDEFYFASRGVEMKHPLMVQQWYEHFKPSRVLDAGCGRGPFLFFWKWFADYVYGIEISDWAVNHPFHKNVVKGDITTMNAGGFDLVTCIDVLEHLDNEGLDKALKNIVNAGDKFIFSIPFIGNPDLDRDSTHKQFRTREEWIKLIEAHGIKIKETPKHWLFADQILIGEK